MLIATSNSPTQIHQAKVYVKIFLGGLFHAIPLQTFTYLPTCPTSDILCGSLRVQVAVGAKDRKINRPKVGA